MAIASISDGESGSSVRTKLNSVIAIVNTAGIVVVPTGDQTTTLDTAVSVTGLLVALEANSVYKVEGFVHHGCNNTGGVKFAYTIPASTTAFLNLTGFASTATSMVTNAIVASATLSANAFCTANNANGRLVVVGTITTGATAGNFVFKFTSTTAGQTSTIYKEGTVITVTKIA